MKDYSQYTYPELYDILNHINPFKYQNKIEAVRREIELRKERGEVPEQLVPETDWSSLKFWKKKQRHPEFVSESVKE